MYRIAGSSLQGTLVTVGFRLAQGQTMSLSVALAAAAAHSFPVCRRPGVMLPGSRHDHLKRLTTCMHVQRPLLHGGRQFLAPCNNLPSWQLVCS